MDLPRFGIVQNVLPPAEQYLSQRNIRRGNITVSVTSRLSPRLRAPQPGTLLNSQLRPVTSAATGLPPGCLACYKPKEKPKTAHVSDSLHLGCVSPVVQNLHFSEPGKLAQEAPSYFVRSDSAVNFGTEQAVPVQRLLSRKSSLHTAATAQ